jgi:hypothetical protein
MAIEDITDPDAVLRALAEFDQLGHEALRHKYEFGKAVRWYLEHNGRLYDTKAVLGVAHKYQFGDALGPRNFYGGAPTNNVLKRLGFTVVNTDEMAPLASGATGFWIFAARPDRYRLLDSVRELDEDEWRTAGSDVRAGDRVAVWQYRGGGKLRGVVALGQILTNPRETTASDESHPFWIAGADPLPDTAMRARVRYALRPDPPLWLEEAPPDSVLHRLSVVKAQGGTVFRVREEDWMELVELAGGWPDATSSEAAAEAEIEQLIRPARGQGFGLSVDDRLAVEHRAMDVVRNHFVAEGWTVKDVYRWKSYDLEATRGSSEVRHLEVKGTTGGADSVFLTKNEVAWTRAHPAESALAVVHGISLDREEVPASAVGGTLRLIYPWDILEAALIPLAYRYAIPPRSGESVGRADGAHQPSADADRRSSQRVRPKRQPDTKDLDDAKRQLQEAGLAFPPVPSKFVRRFRSIGPWHWGSRAVNPLSMYMFAHFASKDERVTVPRDYVALCHFGHGVNSYALTYHLVYRPIALIFQIGWGGVYMDSAETAALFDQQCKLSAGLVELADRVRALRGAGTDVGLLEISDLREVSGFAVIDGSGLRHGRRARAAHESFDESVRIVYDKASDWLTDQL